MQSGRLQPMAARMTEPKDKPSPRQDLAVAIKDDGGPSAPDPRIVAKGRGALAEEILALAFANGVKVRQDVELVEILEAVEVDSPVPLDALATVAEILAYVYASGRPQAVAGEQP